MTKSGARYSQTMMTLKFGSANIFSYDLNHQVETSLGPLFVSSRADVALDFCAEDQE
jgi:hypothetical protein